MNDKFQQKSFFTTMNILLINIKYNSHLKQFKKRRNIMNLINNDADRIINMIFNIYNPKLVNLFVIW